MSSVLNIFAIREQVIIPNYWGGLNETGAYQFTEAQTKAVKDMLSKLLFWSEEMKLAKAKLVK